MPTASQSSPSNGSPNFQCSSHRPFDAAHAFAPEHPPISDPSNGARSPPSHGPYSSPHHQPGLPDGMAPGGWFAICHSSSNSCAFESSRAAPSPDLEPTHASTGRVNEAAAFSGAGSATPLVCSGCPVWGTYVIPSWVMTPDGSSPATPSAPSQAKVGGASLLGTPNSVLL